MEAVSTLALYALAGLCVQGLIALAPIALGLGIGRLIEWLDDQITAWRPMGK